MDNKNELIDYYANQKIQGRYLSEIRKELLQKGYSETETSSFINKIDERVLQHELDKTKAKINKQILYFGVFLIVVGVVVFILSRSGIFTIQRDLAISSTTIFVGLALFVYSLVFSQHPRKKRR